MSRTSEFFRQDMRIAPGEAILNVLGPTIHRQINRLIALGYNNNPFATPVSADEYRKRTVAFALQNLTPHDVEKYLNEKREPILVDKTIGQYGLVADLHQVNRSQIEEKEKNSISFRMGPIDRGTWYLREKGKGWAYIAWIKPIEYKNNVRIVDIESGLTPNERAADYYETMAYFREHPELRGSDISLLILGERYFLPLVSGNKFDVENYAVPIIVNKNEDSYLDSIRQTHTLKECPKGIFLAAAYNPQKLITQRNPNFFPRK